MTPQDFQLLFEGLQAAGAIAPPEPTCKGNRDALKRKSPGDDDEFDEADGALDEATPALLAGSDSDIEGKAFFSGDDAAEENAESQRDQLQALMLFLFLAVFGKIRRTSSTSPPTSPPPPNPTARRAGASSGTPLPSARF